MMWLLKSTVKVNLLTVKEFYTVYCYNCFILLLAIVANHLL